MTSSQRQDSLDDQMRDVMRLAVEAGCYDAHDWLLRNYARAQLLTEPEPCPQCGTTSEICPLPEHDSCPYDGDERQA